MDSITPTEPLQPLPVPDRIWGYITMDFVEGLPKSQGKDSITVLVDRLSKYGNFVALSHPYTAKQVATVFICEVVRLHGSQSQSYRIEIKSSLVTSGSSYSRVREPS